MELGVVLCEATPGHAHFLPNTSLGQLLRLADAHDEQAAARMQERGHRLFEDSRRLAVALNLPLEILDVEVLLDGRYAIIHHLCGSPCDERPFISTLTREHDIQVALHDLSVSPEMQEHANGCGRPDCGRGSGGGCSTCGSGGGCSTCGLSQPQDVTAYFAELREKMLASPNRTPLL
jgi:hypothetical protein